MNNCRLDRRRPVDHSRVARSKTRGRDGVHEEARVYTAVNEEECKQHLGKPYTLKLKGDGGRLAKKRAKTKETQLRAEEVFSPYGDSVSSHVLRHIRVRRDVAMVVPSGVRRVAHEALRSATDKTHWHRERRG